MNLICTIIGHAPNVTDEEELDGGDYVEVTNTCRRCSREETDILEYSEV